MKRLLTVSGLVVFFAGCNVNESKEGRIQKIEEQNEQAAIRLQQLEARIQVIESKLSGD
jgi:hypothetical protein